MEWDRNEKIEKIKVPITVQPFCHPFRKKRGEVSFPFIFPAMDCCLERPFEGSQSPCHCKIFSVLHTSTARVVLDLSRDKGSAAYGTKGRFDPVDLRETI
jgi:hypothetical protein